VKERLTILVIVGTSMDEHSLRSQVGMGSESDCLFGQLARILWTSDSEAGVKTEKSGRVPGGEGECGDDVVGLLVRERRSLDILLVKKDAKLSASEVPGEVVGSGEEDLRCRSWVALPWELLYADDLAVIAETEEELIKRLNEWNDNVESKGMRLI